MTLIEKIARSICRSRYGDGQLWYLFSDDAGEVLRSMREPTESMLDAGEAAFSVPDAIGAGDAWQAMIDQAIKEGE